MASLKSVGSIRMSAWPRLTVCPASTKRSNTLPGTRNPRSLCTRAATMPLNERSDSMEISTVSVRTSGTWSRGSFAEELACLHAAKANGNSPMKATSAISRSWSMGTSPLQRGRGPWPGQRTEPGAARDGGQVDEPRGDKPDALRKEHVQELTGPAQRQPASQRSDCKTRHGAEERPQQPACALRREVK